MSEDPKYVIAENEIEGGTEVFVLSVIHNHSSVVKHFHKVVSAGFFQIFINDKGRPDICCYGKSVTLEVESRPEKDSVLLQRFFNLLN